LNGALLSMAATALRKNSTNATDSHVLTACASVNVAADLVENAASAKSRVTSVPEVVMTARPRRSNDSLRIS
jgi:hypothetical protein